MKFAFIGSYPPRKCGIGTFTHNLIKSISDNLGYNSLFPNVHMIAVNDIDQEYIYPPEVSLVIRQNDQNDYFSAAKYINYNKIDACILEHEFGLFGGESGLYILSLTSRIEIPLIVTFHTVIKTLQIFKEL